MLRIRAAADARSDPDFVIIARTDEATLDGILRRGHAFAKAGADVFMPRTIKPDQIDCVTAEVGLPILGVNLPIADVRHEAQDQRLRRARVGSRHGVVRHDHAGAERKG